MNSDRRRTTTRTRDDDENTNENNSDNEGLLVAGILGLGVAFIGGAVGLYKLLSGNNTPTPQSSGNNTPTPQSSGNNTPTPQSNSSYNVKNIPTASTSSRPITTHQVLELLSKSIGLDDDKKKDRNEKIKNIIERVIQRLKTDKLFELLYESIVWTGSFYEGLKVDEPDEYDINIVLKLPKLVITQLIFTAPTFYPGFINIKNFKTAVENLRTRHNQAETYMKMLKWSSENGSLRQDKFREWYQSLLDKYFKPHINEIYRQISDVIEVKLVESGPARTLKIKLKDSSIISIDLVPVLKFDANILPPGFKPTNYPIFAVPKQKDGQNEIWRVSYCFGEKYILNDLRAVKPAIRLLKKLRDTQQWSHLHSYFIKNVALWEIEALGPSGLRTMNLEETFFHFFDKLHERVRVNSLNFYWNPKMNLLNDMNTITRLNIAGRMANIKKEFDKYRNNDPQNIGKLICPVTTNILFSRM